MLRVPNSIAGETFSSQWHNKEALASSQRGIELPTTSFDRMFNRQNSGNCDHPTLHPHKVPPW